jgi:hypothetical protein
LRSGQMGIRGVVAFTVLAVPSLASAQQFSLKTQPGKEVGLSASYYKYQEPSLAVTEKGAKAGIDFAWTATPHDDWFIRGDGRLALGRNDYTGSGTKNGNPDWYAELRGTAGKDFENDGYSLSPYLGVGYRFLANDLRGSTSTGALGYRRTSQYLYVPAGVVHRLALASDARLSSTLEFDYLVQGWQNSYLSNVSTLVPDQTNRQHRGFGVRASMYYEKANWSFGPWFQYWSINQSATTSATVTALGNSFPVFFFEPQNKTAEIGLRAGYKF